MTRETGSVKVGAYLLQVGNDGGTVVQQGGGGDETEIDALRRALERPEPKAEERAPALTAEIDEAAEATSKIEQAVALCKGVSEGHALDPDQLALEVGSLLDCLERLDRKKKHKKAIQMARSLSTLLMLLKRWASLLQTVRIALRAGRTLDDQAAVAWAEHELGTLKLAADDVEGAEHCLRQARELRGRIGDRQGLAATNHNLGTLCKRLRNMVRDEELVRKDGERLTLGRALSFAALCAAFFGGGIAAATIVADDPAQKPVAVTKGNRKPVPARTTTLTTTSPPETVTSVETVTTVETTTVKVGGEEPVTP